MNAATTSSFQYALSPHMFLCVSDDDVVMLDLAHDKYLAIQADSAAGLRNLVRNWPLGTEADDARPTVRASKLADALEARGILTKDLERGKDTAPLVLPKPTREITADSVVSRPPARLGDLAVFIRALLVARWLKRNRSVEQIVRRMQDRKVSAGRAASSRLDEEVASRLVVRFESLRTVFLSTHNACFLQSVVLLEVFAHYGLFPSWVFGVKTRPFSAHCWLQHGNVVLADTLDCVGSYKPIVIV